MSVSEKHSRKKKHCTCSVPKKIVLAFKTIKTTVRTKKSPPKTAHALSGQHNGLRYLDHDFPPKFATLRRQSSSTPFHKRGAKRCLRTPVAYPPQTTSATVELQQEHPGKLEAEKCSDKQVVVATGGFNGGAKSPRIRRQDVYSCVELNMFKSAKTTIFPSQRAVLTPPRVLDRLRVWSLLAYRERHVQGNHATSVPVWWAYSTSGLVSSSRSSTPTPV